MANCWPMAPPPPAPAPTGTNNKEFFYSSYDAPNATTKLADVNYFQKLYFHTVDTPKSADTLVYDRPE